MKPRLLDLFCGAGLAADGYIAAGWDVVGVDIEPQPDYPGEFIQADALNVLDLVKFREVVDPRHEWGALRLGDFDAIHASPPCQAFTRAGRLRDAQGGVSKYADLLRPTLYRLLRLSIPWVVENVEGAKALMPGAVRLCGSSFGLDVQRHRLFLSNMPLTGTDCRHVRFPADSITGKPRPWGVYHVPGDSIPHGGRTARDAAHAAELFHSRLLPWNSLKEGFPPAYRMDRHAAPPGNRNPSSRMTHPTDLNLYQWSVT